VLGDDDRFMARLVAQRAKRLLELAGADPGRGHGKISILEILSKIA
jgi:hypothetical protein